MSRVQKILETKIKTAILRADKNYCAIKKNYYYEKSKKILWLIVCALTVLCLIGCEWAESKPVNPKILGTDNIQSEKGLVFVEIDSVRYAVNKVFTTERDSRTGSEITIDAVDGMLVTAFLADNSEDVQFIVGKKNAVEIEAVFHRNRVFLFVFGFIITGCLIMLGVSAYEKRAAKKKIPIAKADADD